eukprot:3178119-Pleurochrysis_carterae.AAC.1
MSRRNSVRAGRRGSTTSSTCRAATARRSGAPPSCSWPLSPDPRRNPAGGAPSADRVSDTLSFQARHSLPPHSH